MFPKILALKIKVKNEYFICDDILDPEYKIAEPILF